jgi:hypothetical protein
MGMWSGVGRRPEMPQILALSDGACNLIQKIQLPTRVWSFGRPFAFGNISKAKQPVTHLPVAQRQLCSQQPILLAFLILRQHFSFDQWLSGGEH